MCEPQTIRRGKQAMSPCTWDHLASPITHNRVPHNTLHSFGLNQYWLPCLEHIDSSESLIGSAVVPSWPSLKPLPLNMMISPCDICLFQQPLLWPMMSLLGHRQYIFFIHVFYISRYLTAHLSPFSLNLFWKIWSNKGHLKICHDFGLWIALGSSYGRLWPWF